MFGFFGECWEKSKRSGKERSDLNSKKIVEVEEKRRERKEGKERKERAGVRTSPVPQSKTLQILIMGQKTKE